VRKRELGGSGPRQMDGGGAPSQDSGTAAVNASQGQSRPVKTSSSSVAGQGMLWMG
jgi:hypothetical protein